MHIFGPRCFPVNPAADSVPSLPSLHLPHMHTLKFQNLTFKNCSRRNRFYVQTIILFTLAKFWVHLTERRDAKGHPHCLGEDPEPPRPIGGSTCWLSLSSWRICRWANRSSLLRARCCPFPSLFFTVDCHSPCTRSPAWRTDSDFLFEFDLARVYLKH